jgi:hypothetical protein
VCVLSTLPASCPSRCPGSEGVTAQGGCWQTPLLPSGGGDRAATSTLRCSGCARRQGLLRSNKCT